jgi:hypothetical protein
MQLSTIPNESIWTRQDYPHRRPLYRCIVAGILIVILFSLFNLLQEQRFVWKSDDSTTMMQRINHVRMEHNENLSTSFFSGNEVYEEELPQQQQQQQQQQLPPQVIPDEVQVPRHVIRNKSLPSISFVPNAMYKFPERPIRNIDTILKESIGANILQNPRFNPLRNCSPTVQFKLLSFATIYSNNNKDFLTYTYTIQSMMMLPPSIAVADSTPPSSSPPPRQIVPKPIGGDELYVEWQADVDMGIAMITDMDNGTYALKFIRPPLLQHNRTIITGPTASQFATNDNAPLGRLTIYYDYTCGIGDLFAPNKERYQRAGEVQLSFTQNDIPQPYIHDFIPPNTNPSIHTNDDADAFTTSNTDEMMDQRVTAQKGNHDNQIDLSKYDTVIAFGDSLMLQLVRQYTLGGFWSPNIVYHQNINQCLSTKNETIAALEKFNTWHGGDIIKWTTTMNRTVAVIAGSAVWDAMRGCVRTDLVDHRTSIRQFIRQIRKLYPQIDLYWKSPSAIVLHRCGPLKDTDINNIWLKRSRYISEGVPRAIYTAQKELMQTLQVPFLDLYDAYYLSAPWSRPGDSRHYEDEISSLLLSYYWRGLNRTRVFYHRRI